MSERLDWLHAVRSSRVFHLLWQREIRDQVPINGVMPCDIHRLSYVRTCTVVSFYVTTVGFVWP